MFDLHVTNWSIFGNDPVEGVERTAEVGVPGFEFFGWDEEQVGAVAAAADEHGVDVVSAGATGVAANASGGGPSMTDPSLVEEAVADVERALAATEPLDLDVMVLTVGPERPRTSRAAQHNAVVDTLRGAAPAAAARDVTLVVEPLNTRVDHPGYFLTTTDEAVEIVHAVDHPNVKVLYDVYHQQVTEGNLVDTIREHADDVGLYHVADVPGRHEPGTGEIAYERVFEAIAETGYEGSIGMEFTPTGDPEAAVERVVELRERVAAGR